MHAGKWARDQTKRACSDFLQPCLAFINSTSPSLHQRNSWCSAKHSYVWVVHPAEQLLHWQKRRGWFNIGFCIRSTWWAYFQRSYGRYKSKVCLQASSVMLKKEPWMFVQAVEYILKWGNISILGTYIFKRKCCPFIFRASQYICRQIITLPPTATG